MDPSDEPLVVGDLSVNEGADLLGCRGGSWGLGVHHDERARNCAAVDQLKVRIWNSWISRTLCGLVVVVERSDSTVEDHWERQQDALQLRWGDLEAPNLHKGGISSCELSSRPTTHLDELLQAIHDPVVSVLVPAANVASPEPAFTHRFARGLLVVDIT